MLTASLRLTQFSLVVVVAMIASKSSLAEDSSSTGLKILEDGATIAVKANDRLILVYNKMSPQAPKGIDSIFERSAFIHPVVSPQGKTLTDAFPEDHPHQQGIFSAWVKTTYKDRNVDFWNLDGRTGRVVHDRVTKKLQSEDRVEIAVEMLHQAINPTPVDVLREEWRIIVYPPRSDYYQFDIESTQQAVANESLIVEEYHYGGMALRGPLPWLLSKDKSSSKLKSDVRLEENAFINDQGQDRNVGNHARSKWVTLTGELDGQSVSITVLSHPENFRAPQPARLHGTKPYFCFSPCVLGKFEINGNVKIRNKYRYIVMDGTPNSDLINKHWNEFASGR